MKLKKRKNKKKNKKKRKNKLKKKRPRPGGGKMHSILPFQMDKKHGPVANLRLLCKSNRKLYKYNRKAI